MEDEKKPGGLTPKTAHLMPPWKPGQSGNPAGRPMQACQRLGEKFIKTLADDFDAYGEEAIRKLRESDPARYAAIVASLMPKALEVAIQQQTMSIYPEDWQNIIRIARTLKEIAPTATADEIEQALRSSFARQIPIASDGQT
jgi:hypothetical protein